MGSSAVGCSAVTPCNCHLHVLMMLAPWREEGAAWGGKMELWTLAQAIILYPVFVSTLAPDSAGVL